MIRKLWLVVALAVAGCGTGGAWSKDGFAQKTYGWKASYQPGTTALLGASWRVDNWDQPDGAGAMSDNLGDASVTPSGEKTGPGFTIDYDDDANGDGKIDANESGRKFLYDLKLAHVPDEGVIWVKTRTLSDGDVRKSLELLSESYLRSGHPSVSISGVGYSPTAVVNRTETRLGPYRALAVSLEAQAPSSRNKELRRIDLFFAKYEYQLDEPPKVTSSSGPETAPPGASEYEPHFAVAFVVIGYVNTASRFDGSRGDLDQLLARMHWPQPPRHEPGVRHPRLTPEEEGESRWSADGFEQLRYGWKASRVEAGKDFVSSSWRLREGAPAAGGSGYTGSSDLSFENVHNNGFIWTDTTTLSSDEATKDLDVLFENYVGHLSEVGFGGHAVMGAREELKLGPHLAVSATVEREPTAAEREGRVKTIATKLRLVVTKYEFVQQSKRPGVAGERHAAFMVIGYANDSTRFDAGLEDFVRFLGRISWPSVQRAQPGGGPARQSVRPSRPPAKPLDPNQPKIET